MGTEKKIVNEIAQNYGLKNIAIYWFPPAIYCLFIFFQSSYPSPESIPDLPYIDKVLHFFGYAVLGALFFRAFKSLNSIRHLKTVIILSVLFSSLYGIGDELHQYFIPYRNADFMDAVADTMGSLAGVYIYRFLSARFPKLMD